MHMYPALHDQYAEPLLTRSIVDIPCPGQMHLALRNLSLPTRSSAYKAAGDARTSYTPHVPPYYFSSSLTFPLYRRQSRLSYRLLPEQAYPPLLHIPVIRNRFLYVLSTSPRPPSLFGHHHFLIRTSLQSPVVSHRDKR